ncbi:MAG: hypothetical protein AAGD11_18695 [Planctomycetota bacterium]
MPATTSKYDSGRGIRGRFAAGKKFDRGRTRREVEEEFLWDVWNGCPPDKLQAILSRMSVKALTGDVAAARLVLAHVRPPNDFCIELASSGDEYRVADRSPAAGMSAMMELISTNIIRNA